MDKLRHPVVILTAIVASSFASFQAGRLTAQNPASASSVNARDAITRNDNSSKAVPQNQNSKAVHTTQTSPEKILTDAPSSFDLAEPLASPSTDNYKQAKKNHDYIQAFSSFLEEASQNNSSSPEQKIQENFDSENIDYAWALDHENQLLSVFENQPTLNDISPLSVACKSKNCQIVVAINSVEQMNDLPGRLTTTLTSPGTEMEMDNPTVSYFLREDTLELVLYVSNEGNTSLFEKP